MKQSMTDVRTVSSDTLRHQSTNFTSGESGGTASAIGARNSQTLGQEFEREDRLADDARRRLRRDEMREGSGSRRTSKRAVLEIGVRAHVMMRMVRRHWRLQACRTDFQQKWHAGRRHEANGDVGTKQEQRQHDAGREIESPALSEGTHVVCAIMPDSAACRPTAGVSRVDSNHQGGSTASSGREHRGTVEAPGAQVGQRLVGLPQRIARRFNLDSDLRHQLQKIESVLTREIRNRYEFALFPQ